MHIWTLSCYNSYRMRASAGAGAAIITLARIQRHDNAAPRSISSLRLVRSVNASRMSLMKAVANEIDRGQLLVNALNSNATGVSALMWMTPQR